MRWQFCRPLDKGRERGVPKMPGRSPDLLGDGELEEGLGVLGEDIQSEDNTIFGQKPTRVKMNDDKIQELTFLKRDGLSQKVHVGFQNPLELGQPVSVVPELPVVSDHGEVIAESTGFVVKADGDHGGD